jgi:hypothetical protein
MWEDNKASRGEGFKGVAFFGVDHACGHVGWGRDVTIKGCDVRGERGCEGFKGFPAEVCGDGFPSTSVIAFEEGEEEFEDTIIVSVMSEAERRGEVTCHMAA